MTDPRAEIDAERTRQELKWGEQNHSPDRWLVILGEEFGECCKDSFEGRYSLLRTELIHVAAVAIAVIESLDRNELAEDPHP